MGGGLCACSAHYYSPIKGVVKFACVGGASCLYRAHGQQLSTTGKEMICENSDKA